MDRSFSNDDRGVSSGIIAFGVAGVIFLASIVGVLGISRQAGNSAVVGEPQEALMLKEQASRLAAVLLDSSGHKLNGGDWAPVNTWGDGDPAADTVTRLGLLDHDLQHGLKFTKLQNLRRAPFVDTLGNDGYVNYPEAREGLGLEGAGLDFHIRAFPSLLSVQQLLKGGYQDTNLRVMYIGDIVEERGGSGGIADGLGVTTPVCITDSTTSPGAFRIATQITNGGTATTPFEVVFDVRLSNGNAEYHKQNTALLAPGASVWSHADVARTDVGTTTERRCNGATVEVKVYDSTNLLKTVTTTIAAEPTAPDAAPRGLVLLTDDDTYLTSEAGKFTYSGQNLAWKDELIMTICPGDTECRVGSESTGVTTTCTGSTECSLAFDATGTIAQITVPNKEKDRFISFADETFPAGTYMVRLYDNPDKDDAIETSSMRDHVRLVVVDTEPSAYVPPSGTAGSGNYVASEAAKQEIAYLEILIEKFCPTWFDSTAGSAITGWGTWADPDADGPEVGRCSGFKGGQPHVGDVYPQLKKTLKDELSKRLMTGDGCTGTARYDYTRVLIVGSEVDHNVLTSGDVKQCIEAWVLGGGTLLVFGSQEMNTHWLESVFHTALESSSGGISVPDASHPVLHVADDLQFTEYDHDRAWRLKTTGAFDAESAFTRVANDAASGDAILAVGDPGAFQGGNIILTGWTPYDLGTSNDYLEGMKLVNNLLMLGYRDLYLDYGPALPPNTEVVPAVRYVQVQHPEFEDPIDLSVIVYVF